MGAVGVLVLLLLIPLRMVRSVLSERLYRRDAAVAEIASIWGETQVVAGPIWVIPYRYTYKTWKEQMVAGRAERVEVAETAVGRAHFLPEAFQAEVQLDPEIRYRGIYRAVVYRGRVTLSGTFQPPSFHEWKIAPEDILWDDAHVWLHVADLRGTQGRLTLQWGSLDIPLRPSPRADAPGLEGRLALDSPPSAPMPFRLELTINGSGGLRIAPIGESSNVRMASTWPDPSFQGAFLPTEREVGPNGFRAAWSVSYYGRGYPQQWLEEPSGGNVRPLPPLRSGLLGVNLISLLDIYRLVERSLKYGVLVVALVFATFFLFERLARVRVHPLQYTLVGGALCLFYLGLLSMSELMPFGLAYLVSATAATALIGWYATAMLRSGRRSALLTAGLGVTYAFLYILLRQQDYSLLLGTVGLFIVLALIMAATRRVDWYAPPAPPHLP